MAVLAVIGTVLLTILKILLWTILAVLVIVAVALCIRVKIGAEYSDYGSSVVLQWLFIKIPLYPMKKKEKKEEPPAEEEEEEEEEEEPEEEKEEEEKPEKEKGKNTLLADFYNANGIDGILLLVRRIFSYLGTFIGDLMRFIVIEELQINMACTKKNDAAETAIYYGEVCSALFPMLGSIASKCRIKQYDVNVYPDFLANYSRASFFVKLHFTPMYLIAITVVLVCRLVFKAILRPIVKTFLQKGKNNAGNSDKPQANKKNEKREQTV